MNVRILLAMIGVGAGVFAPTVVSAAEPGETVTETVDATSLDDGITPTELRIVDTRSSIGRVAGGTAIQIDVEQFGVSPGDAVLANVVAVDPSADGFLTVYDCRPELPEQSAVNYVARRSIANMAYSSLTDGAFCVYTSADAHIVVDLVGSLNPLAGTPAEPRIVDTRNANPGAVTTIPQGWNLTSGVAADMVLANLTVTNTTAAGHVSVVGCAQAGDDQATSVINFEPGQTRANMVLVPAQSCLVTNAPGTFDIVLDVYGGAAASGEATQGAWLVAPDAITDRLVDTRVEDQSDEPSGRYEAGETRVYAPRLFHPGMFSMNITAVNPGADGHLTVWECESADDEPPVRSSMNYNSGSTIAHQSFVYSHTWQVCVHSSAATDVVIDTPITVLPPGPGVLVRNACDATDLITDGMNAWVASADDVVGWVGSGDVSVDVAPPAGWTVDNLADLVITPTDEVMPGTYRAEVTVTDANGSATFFVSLIKRADGDPGIPSLC